MTPAEVVHSVAGTFQRSAAAEISMARAAAPPCRTYTTDERMPRLPPVDMSPQARLLARFASGETNSPRTLFQSQSSSSATNWARPVIVP